MANNANNQNQNQNTLEHEGFTLPIIQATTLGRKGEAGKAYYTLDFAELLATKTDASGNKIADDHQTGANLLRFFRGFDSLMSFVEPDFNKAMVSLQVTTPANSKTPKTLSDAEKLAALRAYVATIDEVTRQRSGKASELKRLVKAQAELMRNFTPDKTPQLIALATQIAALQTEIDAAKDAE